MPGEASRFTIPLSLVLVIGVVLGGVACSSSAPKPGPNCAPEPNTAMAPELDGGVAWLNTDKPWRLADLRGQVVFLDFWTYGCINCLHQMPIIASIEDRFEGRPFVVIGVHSANFSAEKDVQNIDLAIEQYDIRHPVVVDSNLAIWNAYKVEAWPTAIIIDAEGRLRFYEAGEYTEDSAANPIESLLDEAKCRGIAGSPIDYLTNPLARANTPLLFPTAVLAFDDGRVAISDSGHNRIVLMQSEGSVAAVFGSGVAGFSDGPAAEAEFSAPEGLAQKDGTLYVADAGNHALRAIDLSTLAVTTVAGTGKEADLLNATTAWLPATTTAMNSPWDLEPTSAGIVVAMAGDDQLALFDPDGSRFRWLSGDGIEGLADGDAGDCEYAQPSALSPSPDGTEVYVANQESSSIAAVTLADGSCRTLVGTSLTVSGDQDGTGATVLLQHPSGIETLDSGDVLVADTYNSKIKDLVPSTETVTTVDWPPEALATDQPRGISRAGNLVYVADTDHHRILEHDLAADETHEFDLGNLAAPPSFAAQDD